MCLALLTCAFSVRPPKPSLGIPYQTDWRFCCCCCCFLFFFLFPLHYLQPSTILSSKKKYFYIYAATAQQFVLANFPSFIRCYIKIRVLFRLILSWETIPESLRTEKEWGSKKKKETRETRCYPPAHPEHFLNHPLPIFRVPSDVSIDRVVIVQNDYSVVSRFPVSVPPFSGR